MSLASSCVNLLFQNVCPLEDFLIRNSLFPVQMNVFIKKGKNSEKIEKKPEKRPFSDSSSFAKEVGGKNTLEKPPCLYTSYFWQFWLENVKSFSNYNQKIYLLKDAHEQKCAPVIFFFSSFRNSANLGIFPKNTIFFHNFTKIQFLRFYKFLHFYVFYKKIL